MLEGERWIERGFTIVGGREMDRERESMDRERERDGYREGKRWIERGREMDRERERDG